MFDIVEGSAQRGNFEMRVAIDEAGNDRRLAEILHLCIRILGGYIGSRADRHDSSRLDRNRSERNRLG